MTYSASAENTGPALLVVTFLCLIVSILVVIARVGTRLWLQRKTGIDDLFIGISLVLSAIQSILVSREIVHGLGQRREKLTTKNIEQLLEFQYAADLLLVLSLAFAKFSVLTFVHKISPQKKAQLSANVLCTAIGVWTVISLFLIAFQCSMPTPWRYVSSTAPRCLDRAAIWTVIQAFNIVFDLAIIALPTIILARVQTSLSKRITAISMFACRIVVIIVTIPQIVYVRAAIREADILYHLHAAVICTQLLITASIACSSMQYLKPFLDSIESGLMRADQGRREQLSKYGSARYGTQISQANTHIGNAVPLKRISFKPQESYLSHHNQHHNQHHHNHVRRDSDEQSDGSESKIIQTRTFEVSSEPVATRSHAL